MDQNLYFVIPAIAKNEAEAIGEAKRIGEAIGARLPIELRVCGNHTPVAKVFANGKVCVLRTED